MSSVPVETDEIVYVDKTKVLSDPVKSSDEDIENRKLFWARTLRERNIRNVVAPMVDQSELAFRAMMRAHGAHLTFTPMIHAQLFVSDTTYRRKNLSLHMSDRPVIVQFCANKAEILRDACRLVEGICDGVDLNLGCPQNVARRGHYGCFLQDEVDIICEMISAVRDFCSLPISAKIRVRSDRSQTIEYARRLVDAGACMLTVHGRTREMKGVNTGLADWTTIKDIVQAVDVPVIANGNIQMSGDVERCLEVTTAHAVMSAEGILYNPYLFEGKNPVSWKVALEYLEYARRFHAEVSAMRAHIFRICQYSLLEHDDIRQRISLVHSIEEFTQAVRELGDRVEEERKKKESLEAEEAAYVLFDRVARGEIVLDASIVAQTPHWLCKPYIRLCDVTRAKNEEGIEESWKEKKKEEVRRKAEESGMSIRQLRKKERRALQAKKTIIREKKAKFPPCSRCTQPAGQSCTNTQCKKCCRWTCRAQSSICKSHRYNFVDKGNGSVGTAEDVPV